MKLPRVPPFGLLRMAGLAVVAIACAGWAVARHFGHVPAPMLVPVSAPAPTYDADAGEMPVPDEFLEPDGAIE